MSSLNRASIIGNLGNDPEVRYAQSGDAIASISVATSEKWKDKQTGETKERTTWHRVKFFGRLAEVAGEYLKKGSKVYVDGKMRVDEYTDKEGVKRYDHHIVGDNLVMLSGKDDGQRGSDRGGQRSERSAPQQQSAPFDDDDIPF